MLRWKFLLNYLSVNDSSVALSKDQLQTLLPSFMFIPMFSSVRRVSHELCCHIKSHKININVSKFNFFLFRLNFFYFHISSSRYKNIKNVFICSLSAGLQSFKRNISTSWKLKWGKNGPQSTVKRRRKNFTSKTNLSADPPCRHSEHSLHGVATSISWAHTGSKQTFTLEAFS